MIMCLDKQKGAECTGAGSSRNGRGAVALDGRYCNPARFVSFRCERKDGMNIFRLEKHYLYDPLLCL